MRVLIVGGGGYIGSHMVKLLCREGFDVVTLDNFSAGYRDAVTGGELVDSGQLDEFVALLPTRRVPVTETWLTPLWLAR